MATTLRTLKTLWIEDQVDDFVAGMGVLAEELRVRGFAVTPPEHSDAKTVDQAERLLEEWESSNRIPDVILLDLMLPQDDEDLGQRRVDLDGGYLVWFELRKMQKWPSLVKVPILIITARGRPEYRDQVVEDRATRWLSKPADPSRVAEEIQRLLGSTQTDSQPCSEQLSKHSAKQN